MFKPLALFLILIAIPCLGEPPTAMEKGRWGLGFQGAAGVGVNGTSTDTELVWSGVRYKRILTNLFGKGRLRGNLEYGAEAIPLFLVFQEDTVYGFNVSPFLMRWNFTGKNSTVIPFLEWGGGLLFTSGKVPEQTSRFNFTPQAGLGVSIFNTNSSAVMFQMKYMHISNAGLHKPNPGINSVQVLFGYEVFR